MRTAKPSQVVEIGTVVGAAEGGVVHPVSDGFRYVELTGYAQSMEGGF